MLKSTREARSSFLTKDHGLHKLGLCRACNALNFKCLSGTLVQTHLKNCFDLIEQAKICRLCRFIAQNFQKDGDASVRNLLMGLDIVRKSNVPLCFVLSDGQLRATARDVVLAEIQLFSNNGDDDAGLEGLRLCF